MTDNTIDLNQLASRESRTIIEWKENVANIDKVIETIVAFTNDFLNLGGGYIVCGAKEIVDEYGFQKVEYLGLNASRLNEIKKKVTDTCYNPTKVNPPIIPKIDEVEVPNDQSKKVLVFTIDATGKAHTFKSGTGENYKSRYFVRTDSNTRGATNGILKELLRRKGQLEPWDRKINQKATAGDIDQLVLRQYLQDMRLWNPNKTIDQYLSDKEKIEEFIPPLMGRLGVGRPLHPKNFTVLVFGKDQSICSDGAYTIFATFKSEDASQPVGETQWIQGSVVEQAKKLIELLNVETTIAIDKNDEIPNQAKYPTIALKEAVVNALVHRDYEIDQPSRIYVYSNRVEIYSPGGLPFNVSKSKFVKGKATASWRNQSLGRIFSKLQLAQHLGSGIPRIIRAMQEEGCPPPIFKVEDESVTCVLPAHPRHRAMKLIAEIEGDIVIRNYQTALNKILSILKEDVYNYRALELFCELHKVLERPEKVFEFLKENNIDYDQIRPITLINLSEALSLMEGNKEALDLSEKILEKAINERLEERVLVKIAYTMKKLGNNKGVIDFVSNILNKNPLLSTSSNLLQQRARAAIDLAKICRDTARSRMKYSIKEKAKLELKKYLYLAENDLIVALANAQNSIDKEWITKDLEFLKEIKPIFDEEKSRKIDDRKVFVKNLNKSTSNASVKDLFSQFGNIKDIHLMTKEYGKLAIIEFENASSVKKALESRHPLYLDGKKITLDKYRRK